jgi:hypothetical protein
VTPERERLAARFVLASAGLVLIVVGMPYVHLPFSGDHGLFAYEASRVRAGAVLYRDLWDQNGPGIVGIQLVAELLFGHRMLAIRAFDLLWMLATLALLYREGRRAFGPLAASLGVLLAAGTYFTLGHRATAQRDGFSLLPLLGVLALMRRTGRGSGIAAAAAGGLAALALLLKPPLVLAAVGAAAAVLAASPEHRLRRGMAFALGLAGVLAAPLAYFAAHGALGDLYDCVFVFNRQYLLERYSLPALAGGLAERMIARPHLAVGLLALLAAPFQERGRPLAALGAGCLLVLLLQGKLTDYHLVPLELLACLFAGWVVAASLSSARWPRAGGVAAVAVLASALWTSATGFERAKFPALWSAWFHGAPIGLQREEVRLAHLVARDTEAGDTVLIWGLGTSGTVHYVSGRPSPTRFFQNYPFSLREPDTDLIRRWRRQLLEQIEEHPPRLVVIPQGDAWVGIDSVDSTLSFERFAALRAYVSAHYRPLAQVRGWLTYRIYERIDPGMPDSHRGAP